MSDVAEIPVSESGEPEYDVCFSYASEDREYVQKVTAALKPLNIHVFDYQNEETEAELWGANLYEELEHTFEKRGRFCVVFVSKHYVKKLWTRHELKSVLARAVTEKREYLLPTRFDDTELPGVPHSVGYKDLRKKTPEQLAVLIARKVQKLKPRDQETLRWWRRWLSFGLSANTLKWLGALLGVIASIVSAITYLHLHESHTDFTITGANRQFILISAQNEGERASTLQSFKLTFDNAEMKLAQNELLLTPVSENAEQQQTRIVIESQSKPTTIALAARSRLRATCTPVDQCRDEILKQLAARTVTLDVKILESGNPWHVWRLFSPKPYIRPESHEIPEDVRGDFQKFMSGACCNEQ